MMRGRVRMSKRRNALVPLLAVTLVGATAAAAWAHYVYDFKYVWEDGNGKCLKNRSEISDGSNEGGYSKVNAFPQKESYIWNGTGWSKVNCAVGWSRDLKVKTILQKRQSDGSWANCASTDWKYGNSVTELQQEKYWSSPCGSGYYRTKGLTYLELNGTWRGGANTTDPHYLK